MMTRRRLLPVVTLDPEPPSLSERIADYLAAFWPDLPPKHIRMNASGAKYSWVKDDDDQHIPLTYADLLSHAAGGPPVGAYLHTAAGLCRVGMLDIDAGGLSAIAAALDAAKRLGYHAYGLYSPAGQRQGAEHDGGRLVVPFSHLNERDRIVAVMQQIRDAAGLPLCTEIWPGGGQAVALPLGVHLRKQTRGTLITQAGEVVELDTDLAAGFEALLAMPSNGAPPMLVNVSMRAIDPIVSNNGSAPAQASHKVHSAKTAPKVSLGEQAAGRASLADVRDRFNAEHSLESLLDAYGAAQTRDGYSCPFCEHSHQTTLYISKQGKLFSFSPRCKLHTTKGWDAFGLYVLIEHDNNVTAALKALNPIQPRRPAPAEPPIYQTREQAADADRKRAKRREDAAATIADVQARASQDAELSDRAQLAVLALIEMAGDRAWCRPSVARIAEMTGLSRRSVFYALDELARRGYITSDQQHGRTTRRTFVRVQSFDRKVCAIAPGSIASNTPTLDPVGACEGRATPPAESVYPPTLPAWQLAKVTELEAMDDADLRQWMSQFATPDARAGDCTIRTAEKEAPAENRTNRTPESAGDVRTNRTPEKEAPASETGHNCTPKKDAPDAETLQNPTPQRAHDAPCSQGETGLTLNTEPAEPAAVEPVFAVSEPNKNDLPPGWVMRRSGPFTYAFDGQRSTKPSGDAGAVIAAAWSLENLNSRGEFSQVENLRKPEIAEPPSLVKPSIEPPAEPDATENSNYTNTGAVYNPHLDWTNGGRLDLAGWRDPLEMRPREGVGTSDTLDQLDLPEDEPLIRVAPVETEAAEKYYALRAKAKKTTSPAQRHRLDLLADGLMIWLPASEAAQARAAPRIAWAAGARSQARRPPAGPALGTQQALL